MITGSSLPRALSAGALVPNSGAGKLPARFRITYSTLPMTSTSKMTAGIARNGSQSGEPLSLFSPVLLSLAMAFPLLVATGAFGSDDEAPCGSSELAATPLLLVTTAPVGALEAGAPGAPGSPFGAVGSMVGSVTDRVSEVNVVEAVVKVVVGRAVSVGTGVGKGPKGVGTGVGGAGVRRGIGVVGGCDVGKRVKINDCEQKQVPLKQEPEHVDDWHGVLSATKANWLQSPRLLQTFVWHTGAGWKLVHGVFSGWMEKN